MQMINKEALESNGYMYYKVDEGEFCLGMWQKVVRTPGDLKAYFINVRLWQFPQPYNPVHPIQRSDATVTFYKRLDTLDVNHDMFKVELDADKMSLMAVEDFFATMYDAMNCVPDIHNN